MAGHMSGNSGRNSIGLRAEMLSRHFERGFRLLSECLTEPVFADAEVDKERAIQLQEIHTRDDNPSGVVFDLFSRTLYQEHPYRLDVLGEAGVVGRMTGRDLREQFSRYYTPEGLVLSVVGDVDSEGVRTLAEEVLGGRVGRAAPAPKVRLEPPVTERRVAVKRLAKAQAHIVVGHPAVRVNDTDRFAMELLSAVMAGQGGRLFVELRDKRSMAYSVSSFSVEGVDPGYFAVYIGTSPEKVETAIAGMRRELSRLRDEPASDAELSRAKEHLIGVHEIGLQRNGARAATMALDQLYELGAEAYLKYADEIGAVDAAAVQEVARRVLDFERCAVSIVGP
jgi:zinc protease